MRHGRKSRAQRVDGYKRLLTPEIPTGTLKHLCALSLRVVRNFDWLVQNQRTRFDWAGVLPDRSRRGLPCDRSRRPAAHQTDQPETTLGEQV
jgi:hypothetical protein